jgi:hypothetical protein
MRNQTNTQCHPSSDSVGMLSSGFEDGGRTRGLTQRIHSSLQTLITRHSRYACPVCFDSSRCWFGNRLQPASSKSWVSATVRDRAIERSIRSPRCLFAAAIVCLCRLRTPLLHLRPDRYSTAVSAGIGAPWIRVPWTLPVVRGPAVGRVHGQPLLDRPALVTCKMLARVHRQPLLDRPCRLRRRTSVGAPPAPTARTLNGRLARALVLLHQAKMQQQQQQRSQQR